MIFLYLLSISILCQYFRNCNGETGNVGGNFAIIKGLRRSLTGGWKADLIDVPAEEETSGSALQTRQGEGDSETLKEKTKRLVDWHLADEPLKQFDKWNPYDKDR